MNAARQGISRQETWALIAVKRFEFAKTRLAAALPSSARAMLAEAMLEDVLAALAGSSALNGALVVTSDPAAAAIARRAGAAAMNDAQDAGVNAAVAQGLRCLERWHAARVIVVPADVPLLKSSEVDAVAAALDQSKVVLTPAERDGGTNILALSPIDAIAPAYGPDSLKRHAKAARAAGIEPRIMPFSGAGLDIDVSRDLEALARHGAGTRAAALLREISAPTRRAANSLHERIMPQ